MPHFCGRTHSRREWLDDDITPRSAESAAGLNSNTRRRPTQEEIAKLAYSYWEARGGPDGSPLEDWVRAERDLLRDGRDAPRTQLDPLRAERDLRKRSEP